MQIHSFDKIMSLWTLGSFGLYLCIYNNYRKLISFLICIYSLLWGQYSDILNYMLSALLSVMIISRNNYNSMIIFIDK